MKLKKFKWYKNLLICLLFLMIISIITIHSAQTYLSANLGNLALKQFFWYGIGLIIILIIIKIGNEKIYQSAWILYFIGNFLLLLLLFIAPPINNSKCWFIIPGIGSFQPSEFMKIFLMIIVSVIVAKESNKKKTIREEFFLIGKVFLLFLLPSMLTFLEPDTGVVIIYFIICLAILFVSGIRKGWFILAFGILGISIGAFLYLYFCQQKLFVDLLGTDLFYRIDRLLDWKNGTGMQLENSLTAIGSAGLWGHGYNHTPIYFPESGTDFIFAVYASNFGLIGSLVLIGLQLYFDYCLLKLARSIKNNTDKFMLIGISSMLIFQQFQNIAMTLGLVPITGITLPFISYGGSSLLSYMILLGIVFNIYNDNKKSVNF